MTCSSSRRRRTVAAFAACLAVCALGNLVPREASGRVTVKMATLAPDGSSWYRVLQEMGEQWKRASGGEVVLRLYGGGVVGDEGDMLRKIRVGQIQAAAVTGLGLAFLDRAFYALHTPMAFESEEEFRYVRDRLSPKLEKILEEKGFLVLNWGDAGWVHFFSTAPFTRPGELRQRKLYVGAGDTNLTQIYKETGFDPVELSIVDLLPSLQTGLVDVFNTTPLAALSFQWFALAPNMTDLNWSFLSGATVIDLRTWERIPQRHRPKILEISRNATSKLREEIRRLNEEALRAMIRNGLTVVPVSPEARQEWRKLVEEAYPRIRGNVIPAEMFDLVLSYRDEFRKQRKGGSPTR